jgi:hypothetical protein
MRLWEAIKKMQEGKKIRNCGWHQGGYIYITGNNIYDEEVNVFMPMYSDTSDRWELYEEKLKLEKDPYVGKQVIFKINIKVYGMVTRKRSDGNYDTTNGDSATERELKEAYYIEGIDF